MINIGSFLDACGISYTDKQLAKLDKLLHELLNKLSLQQFVSNETTKHDSISYSRTKDFACEIEITPSEHCIQEFNVEPEPCYNDKIKDEMPKESSIEIKEEFPKDPFESLETINHSEDISDMVDEENVESNGSVPMIEKTSNFKCKFCNEDLISKTKLNLHISQMHNSYPIIKEGMPEENENEIKEEIANDSFASLETFKNFNRFCLRCDQTFSSKQDLFQHINNVHDGKVMLKLFEDLPDHQIELQTPNQINIEVFDPSFNQTYDPIDGRFLCSICNQTFSSKGNLKKHEKKFCKSGSIEMNSEDKIRVANKDGRFLCSSCNQTFSSKGNLMKHEKKFCRSGSIKMNSEDQKIVEIKDGRFLCSSCNQTFSTKTNLNKHEKVSCKSGSIKMNAEDQRRIANDNGRFSCRKCNLEFKTKLTVKIHEKKSCKGEEALAIKKGIFSCRYCIQTFSFGTNKLRHEKICKNRPEGVKPLGQKFKCNECDKVFSHQRNLKAHIESIHELKHFPTN